MTRFSLASARRIIGCVDADRTSQPPAEHAISISTEPLCSNLTGVRSSVRPWHASKRSKRGWIKHRRMADLRLADIHPAAPFTVVSGSNTVSSAARLRRLQQLSAQGQVFNDPVAAQFLFQCRASRAVLDACPGLHNTAVTSPRPGFLDVDAYRFARRPPEPNASSGSCEPTPPTSPYTSRHTGQRHREITNTTFGRIRAQPPAFHKVHSAVRLTF